MFSSTPLKILVIDDDPDTRSNLRDILEMDGHQVITAGSAQEGLNRADTSAGVILLDRRLPDGSAGELLPLLKAKAPLSDIMVITGSADLQGVIEAMRQGAMDYILKPINPEALRAALLRLAHKRQLTLDKERSEKAFSALLATAGSIILMLRPDQTIMGFNSIAEEITGYREAEVIGKNFLHLLLPPEVRDGVLQQFDKVLAGQPARAQENRILGKDGTDHWVLWNAQKLDDYQGGPAILIVGQDITTFKRAQEKNLQSARLAAIGEMMAGLAHESGNALARSQACLEMLALEVEDRPDAMDLIKRIQNAQEHLRMLYEEVRNYASPLKLERELWSVRSVWRQAWQNLSIRREGKKTELLEHLPDINLECPIDPFRLEQVFRNVLENSLAACGNDVRITISCEETILDTRPALKIIVKDNGPGLNPEQQRRLFEPFFTTKTKGTGLGMAICQRIVQAHGGTIGIGPNAAQGAEIEIILPREPA